MTCDFADIFHHYTEKLNVMQDCIVVGHQMDINGACLSVCAVAHIVLWLAIKWISMGHVYLCVQ